MEGESWNVTIDGNVIASFNPGPVVRLNYVGLHRLICGDPR